MIGGIPRLDLNLIGSLSGDGSSTAGAATAGGGVGASFGALLTEATSRTVETLRQAEQVSVQALRGEADTRAVVDAVMSAEQSLQAAIAVRDKIVTAYLEVSRMAI
ncbi:MAG: flagellar hook-basal body complex protein FliE [Rhizobiaceae bacterium]